MISKKLDIDRLKMLKIELSEDEFRQMKANIGKRGLKQQFWLRQAVLEKLERDSSHPEASHE